jgi:hypothetical protein
MNINPPAIPLFLVSLFVLGLIGLEIYNGRVSTSRPTRPNFEWTRKNHPYSFWVVISAQLALAVYLLCFSLGLAHALL